MTTETVTKNEDARLELTPPAAEDPLRQLARRKIEGVRKAKLYAASYVLAMVVLGPIWVVTEYMNADGWPERLSDNGNAGDWNPWIVYVALIGLFIVGVAVLKAYFTGPTTEAEIEREIERLKSRRT